MSAMLPSEANMWLCRKRARVSSPTLGEPSQARLCEAISGDDFMADAPVGHRAPIGVRLLRVVCDQIAHAKSSWYKYRDGCEVRDVCFGKANGLELKAPNAREDKTIVYFHGGAHCVFSVYTHRELAGRLSVATSARILAVNYRLAPENPFPAALEDALEAWRWACKEYGPPETIALAGDSAGGNLAFALLVKLAQLGESQPAACLGLAPWLLLDPELLAARRRAQPTLPEGWWSSIRRTDDGKDQKSIWLKGAERCIEHYCQGHSSSDPLVSPLLASQDIIRRFPPILLHLCDGEPLVADAREMTEKCKEAGVTVELKEYSGKTHVFQAFPRTFKEESEDSLARMSAFLEQNWMGSTEIDS